MMAEATTARADDLLIAGLDTDSPWNAIFEQAHMAIAALTPELRFVRVNGPYAAAVGKSPDFFLGQSYLANCPRPEVAAIFRRVVETGVPHAQTAHPFDYGLNPLRGVGCWDWSLSPVADASGRVRYLVLMLQDVTNRLRAEERALLGEADIRSLVGNIPGMIYRGVADWSAKLMLNSELLTGYTAAEIDALPQKWLSLIHADDVATLLAESARMQESPTQVVQVYRITDKSGSLRWVEDRKSSLVVDGVFRGVEGVVFDVSARQRREMPALVNEDRYRALTQTSLDGYLLLDLEGSVLDVNAAYCRLSGYSREELLAMRVADLAAGEGAEDYRKHIDRIVTAGGDLFESTLRRKDGSTWAVEVNAAYWPHLGGRVFAFVRGIDERKRAEAGFRGLFKSMSSGFALHEIIVDAAGKPCDYRFLDVNPAFEAMTGLKAADLVGRTVRDVLPQTEPFWIERYGRVALTGESVQFQEFSGELRRHYRVTAYCPEHGRFAVIFDDVTEMKHRDEQIRQAAAAFEHTRDGIAITDTAANIVAVNRAFSAITGYREDEVIGRHVRILKSGRHAPDFYQEMWNELTENGFWQGEIWNRRKNGEIYPEWLTLSAARNDAGEIERYIGVFTDISRIKAAEAQIEFVTHHDALTGLPNRSLFNLRHQHAAERAARHGHRMGLLVLDLDLFKNINDTLGHVVGDQLLAAVADRLHGRVREEDTLARIGGDEFAVLMEEINAPNDAAMLARDLLDALAAPFALDDLPEIHIAASIGISVSPDDSDDPTLLMRNADAAVYLAKARGRNTFRFYTESLTTAAFERVSVESRLRKAIELGRMVVHYQPLIVAKTGEVIGAEALVRWNDPDEGMIPPLRFIPVAEDSGQIAPLGDWVLGEACRQMKAWQDAGRRLETIAVNLSPRQFQLQDVSEMVLSALAASGLEARYLELEITEGTLMEQGDAAIATIAALDRLRSIGVRLSIDDFGTGYSSLAYLKRFPIDKLKIDRSFVRDITADSGEAEIASTIIAMARSLKLAVCAEGVETAAQVDFLDRHGCDYFQGYFFGHPVAAEEFPEHCR